MQAFFSFWWRVFKTAVQKAWNHYDHWTNVATVLSFVWYAAAGTWIIKHYVGQPEQKEKTVTVWLLAVPVGVAALIFLVHLVKAPCDICKEQCELLERQQSAYDVEKSSLETTVQALRDQKANLEIMCVSEPVRQRNDLHFKVCVKNHGPACAQSVTVRLESATLTGSTKKSICYPLKRWSTSHETENNELTDIHAGNQEVYGLIWTDWKSAGFHTVRKVALASRWVAIVGSDDYREDIDCEVEIGASGKNAEKKLALFRFKWVGDKAPTLDIA